MSHVKNVGAFSRLVGFCTGLGGFNPGRQSLQIEALISQLDEARQAVEDVSVAKATYDNAVNQRKQVFDHVQRLASSVLFTLEANGASPEKLDDARLFFRQINGTSPRSRKPVPSDAQKEISRRSGARWSYVSRADSFSKLVQAVLTEPLYAANEVELSVGGLTEKERELNDLIEAANAAHQSWSQSRIDRNYKLYQKSNSLYHTARAVKKYVRALYGLNSGEYAQFKGIEFTKPKK